MQKIFFTFLLLLLSVSGGFSQGKLFIIGGGKRTPEMIKIMIAESGLNKKGYIVILPMASSEQDSSIYFAKKQFVEAGVKSITGFMMKKGDVLNEKKLDSISKASLIYITGGDQDKFMDIIGGTAVEKAIKMCFDKGNLIAGTSAGAAVMSEKMITGNELKYLNSKRDSDTEDFEVIEANNVEIKRGLGFLKSAIIDQHFIIRKRQNRLISVALENPGITCVGIDEATSILVKDGEATIIGQSQVFVIINTKPSKIKNKKLSGENLRLGIYADGDKFKIK